MKASAANSWDTADVWSMDMDWLQEIAKFIKDLNRIESWQGLTPQSMTMYRINASIGLWNHVRAKFDKDEREYAEGMLRVVNRQNCVLLKNTVLKLKGVDEQATIFTNWIGDKLEEKGILTKKHKYFKPSEAIRDIF